MFLSRVPISEHKFKIGQRLFPVRSVGLNMPEHAYVVVRRFSERDGEFDHQIKNLTEPDERLVARDSIKAKPTAGRLLHGACVDGVASELQGLIRSRGVDRSGEEVDMHVADSEL